MKRKVCLCVLVPTLLLFVSGCQNSMYLKDKKAMELSQMVAESPIPAVTPSPEPVKKEYTREEITELTQEYKVMWQTLDKNLGSLEMSKDSNGVKRYSEANGLKKIEISRDTYGAKYLDYDREYYFEDGFLYFARLTSGAGEMRLYFHQDQLIRWLDEDKKAYDSNEADSDFGIFEYKLLTEADTLAEEFEAEQVILNSYVTD